ncbi:uncharacterized protein L3040_003866 [Drepanopeziza brunnea f. sp. 'multigermtubi']|uniref:DUF7371 domain-containing protein n=1 Tax=Marssonina brunnea f. sp. multigermtubi (strain MB_m1) TaxID=1072389 RepID=K1WC07_MARBU|nr:uncharacterized protein MBM_07131 [Drepanopeziza brunnea f. sp. 'multigermtubi' MB_m1]EKD14920.1 hypothetical protein MBM_07131 [Drepanopeziza brunnea f. sp. 'multigermtubi' MB_m1]KAJ5046628.1 hypothetical protein L3040_003866 [Drepanopeziza brunnea f. sp. 'multigermtubi']
MRPQNLSVLVGAVGLAALAAAAPALSSYDVCQPSITTVFVDVPQVTTITVRENETTAPQYTTITVREDQTSSPQYTTITIHEEETTTATVYHSVPSNVLTPTTTITRVYTILSTKTNYIETTSLSVAVAVSPLVSYETTVTQTAMVTVTEYGSTSTPTPTPTPPSSSILAFIVENGMTFWFGGRKPSSSYVVKTSVVTIVPVYTSVSEELTSTLTLQSTIYMTRTTLTRTLSLAKQTTGPYVQSIASSHTSSWGGWNVTSTAGGVAFPGATDPAKPSSPVSFITEETVDIYKTSSHSYKVTSYAAQGGFKPFSTSSTIWVPAYPTASSTPWTTAVVSGETVSWNVHGVTQTFTQTSPVAPFLNSTEIASQSTSAALGAINPTSGPTSMSSKWPISSPVSSAATCFTSSSFVNVTASTHMGVFPAGTETSFLTSLAPTTLSTMEPTAMSNQSSGTVSSSVMVSSPAPAMPTKCGLLGDFVLNFDDIPPLSVSNQSTDFQPEPVPNPYHKFDFSNGFTVVPPPVDPYLPVSKPLLLEFIPNFTVNASTPESGPNSAQGGFSGEIGNIDHGATGCFSFNFYGASLGCDSFGAACEFTFTGFKFDRLSRQTRSVVTQRVSVPACPSLKSLDCVLTPVSLDGLFKDLDSVGMNVTVQGRPKIWWMDDVRLGWFDNSCEKGVCRTHAPTRHHHAPTHS